MPSSNTRPCRRTLPRKAAIEFFAAGVGDGRFPLDGHDPQRVHHAGDVDRHRAAGGAGFARRAEPDRPRAEHLGLRAQLHQPHDLAGEQVHLGAEGQPVEHLWH